MAAREAEVDQGVEIGIGHREDVAAPAAVAAVRAAEFLVLLVAERDAAVAAVAGGDVDKGFVHELHDGYPVLQRTKPRASRGFELTDRSDWLKPESR